MWSPGWVRLLGAITDVPGDILRASHHKNITVEVVEMVVNKSPFPTRLTRAISFNVPLTRLLGSNNSNSQVTPLQTPTASSFILTLIKKFDQILKAIRFILRLDYSSCWCTTITFSISRLFDNYIFLCMLRILLFTLVEHLAWV